MACVEDVEINSLKFTSDEVTLREKRCCTCANTQLVMECQVREKSTISVQTVSRIQNRYEHFNILCFEAECPDWVTKSNTTIL